MSKYRTLDDGPLTDFSVHRVGVKRTRNDSNDAVRTSSDAAHKHLRKASPANDPLPVTVRWIAQLPRNVRPLNLLRHFPRVANTLATSWPDREAFRKSLYDLLVDKRGNRKGFPGEIVAELLTLRSYFENDS